MVAMTLIQTIKAMFQGAKNALEVPTRPAADMNSDALLEWLGIEKDSAKNISEVTY